MKLTSPSFKNGDFIPERFTCAGENVNPEFTITGIPQGTKSLMLILESSEYGKKIMNVHWIVFDIPITGRIEENSIPGHEGMTSFFGKYHYSGPCPIGRHQYFFKIFALDKMLNLKEGAGSKEIEAAMQGHILDKAVLTALYQGLTML